MKALDGIGFRLSVSGYGASYTSVQALQRLPIDALVIERGLVSELSGEQRATSRQALRAMLALAHALEIDVVADGVQAGVLAAVQSSVQAGMQTGMQDDTKRAGVRRTEPTDSLGHAPSDNEEIS